VTTADRMRRQGQDRREIAAAMAEIRRRDSVEGMLAILRQLAASFGGVDAMAQRVRECVDGANLKYRGKVLLTLIQCGITTEQRQVAAQRAATPMDFMAQLHRDGKLKHVVHQCYERYYFDEDDLNPYPYRCCEHSSTPSLCRLCFPRTLKNAPR